MSRKYFTEPSRVHQSFKDEVDVNNIIRRHRATGVVDHINRSNPQFLDVSTFTDYHESLQRVQSAQDSFFRLPARVREEFSNNPGHLLAFLENPDNKPRAIELGLIPKPVSDPVSKPVSNPISPEVPNV